MTTDDYEIPATGAELVHAPTQARTVDMRERATDSWTDVLDDVITLARGIHSTEFVPDGLRGSVEKVTAAIMYGRELGLPPMTGLGSTHVIEGKAGITAELMRALILQAGHDLVIEQSNREVCKIRGRRAGSDEWTTATWTIQEAHVTQVFLSKQRGWGPLAEKSNWKSWPTEMLLARATTRLARMVFPDVIHGMRTVEEIRDMVEVEDVPEGAPEAPPAAAPVARKRPTRAKTAPPAAAPPVEEQQPSEVSGETPPERVRPSRPAPRTTPPATQERQPTPAPPAEGQAELVEDDTPAPEPQAVDPAPDAIGKGQLRAIQAHWSRLQVPDRSERLYWTGLMAGRPDLTTTNHLTHDEASRVLDVLGKVRDRAGVEEWGADNAPDDDTPEVVDAEVVE